MEGKCKWLTYEWFEVVCGQIQNQHMNLLIKFFASVFMTVCALTPLWIFLLARSMLNPQGFWQNLALSGLSFYILCGAQLLALGLLGVFLIIIWSIAPTCSQFGNKHLESRR